MAGLKHWVWLGEAHIRSASRLALLQHFGTPENIYFAAAEDLLQVEGISAGEARCLQNKDLSEADRILGQCKEKNIRLLTVQDASYPARLKNIYDPPCLLYIRGEMPEIDDGVSVAVVGTRDCTPYGERAAEKIAFGLAEGGVTVVSGLAKGIDAAAMRGALRAGGHPVAVLGGGVDVVYPRENRFLYEDVATRGALISEYPPGTEPKAEHFPIRNRIIAGLSLATLVVEAPRKSGALITAHEALEQGRDVFAVPGAIDAPCSVGCNELIREGASLVSSAQDILREYAAAYPLAISLQGSTKEEKIIGTAEEERRPQSATAALPTLTLSKNDFSDDQILVLKTLREEESLQVDDIVDLTELTVRRVLSALTWLSVEGYTAEEAGKRFRRTVHIKE